MSKKKKMIDIDTLLDDELENELAARNSDMVFVTATEEAPAPTDRELSRIERIEQGRINVNEPLFDGETNLDFGKVTIGNEEDAQLIQKELLEKNKREEAITDSSDKQRDTMVVEMTGEAPEELVAADEEGNVVENPDLEESDLMAPETIDRKVQKKANSRAVQEILEGLLRE
jgi:hypothetical protein